MLLLLFALNKLLLLWHKMQARNPDKERKNGKCPLTPEEVSLILIALGFGNDVHIYIASGEIYGGEETLAPLKAFFPNFYTKETLASKEELAPFSSFSSRMAALDFIVCDESDVFVSNNNGNMARMLAGRRYVFSCFQLESIKASVRDTNLLEPFTGDISVTSQLSVQMLRSFISCLLIELT